jgi:excisionase family DNA binding protein
METSRPLNAEQVAERLGLTVHQVYRRLHRGDIPSTLGGRQGKQYFVSSEDLDAYIEAGQPLSEPARWADDTLTVPQVAMMTGLTCDKVRQLCQSKRLDAIRGAGTRTPQYRIFRSSVVDFLTAAQVPTVKSA